MKIPFFSSKKSVSSKNALAASEHTVAVKSYSELLPQYAFMRATDGSLFAYSLLSLNDVVTYFEQIHPVYTAVMRVADAVADLPVQLVDNNTQEAQPDHAAHKLLKNPNRHTERVRYELIRSLVANYILFGNAYLIITRSPSGEPLELYSGCPADCTYTASKTTGRLETIEINSSQVSKPLIFKKSSDGFFYTATKMQQLYAIHNFNARFSSSDLVGKSELHSLVKQISLYDAATNHNSGILRNGARPTGIFRMVSQNGMPAIVSDEIRERLIEQVNSEYVGATNAGKPILLEGGLEFQAIEMTPRDLDFDKMVERAEDAIYNTLKVPTQLVKPVKTTANNMTNIRKEFYENRVLPLGDMIYEHLSNALLPQYKYQRTTADERYCFKVNRDEIDVLLEERIKKRDSIEKSLIMTVNEKRKIYNLADIDKGNKIVDPNGRPIAGEDAEDTVGANGTVSADSDSPSVAASSDTASVTDDDAATEDE